MTWLECVHLVVIAIQGLNYEAHIFMIHYFYSTSLKDGYFYSPQDLQSNNMVDL